VAQLESTNVRLGGNDTVKELIMGTNILWNSSTVKLSFQDSPTLEENIRKSITALKVEKLA
jgi:hypothetical protein